MSGACAEGSERGVKRRIVSKRIEWSVYGAEREGREAEEVGDAERAREGVGGVSGASGVGNT